MKACAKKTCLVLLFLLTLAWSVTAFAADSTVTYDGNAKKFVFVKDLFPNFKGVMPGDTLTQSITVKNAASNGVKVKIYLRAEPVDTQYHDFLKQMTLTAVQEGDSVLFSAAAHKQGGIASDFCLGTFYSGADVDIKVSLNVPLEMDNRFQNGMGVIKWVFKAEELPIEPDDPNPQTGDVSQLAIYIVIAGISLAAVITLFLVRRAKMLKK